MIDLHKGQRIFYRNEQYIDDIEFVVLTSITDVSVVCVSAKPLKDRMSFDDHGNNDWKTSSLRKYLNEEYIKRFNQDDVVQFNGDLITLLSKGEEELYKPILPKYPTYWWTRSPNIADAFSAWYVDPCGQFGDCNVVLMGHVIPSLTFDLNNMKFSIEDGDVILTSKN